ncbi:unnamed protein product, partial [marine sediment metagenome]
RILLLNKDIRVEHVQDISAEDARAEGALEWWDALEGKEGIERRTKIENDYGGERREHTSIDLFQMLWDSINSKPKPIYKKKKIVSYVSYPWEHIRLTSIYRGLPWRVHGNPWVWAVTFKRITGKGIKHE